MDSWAKRNPEKQRARVARWRAANPEKAVAIYRANHESAKPARNAYSRSYRLANLTAVKAMQSAWSKANPEAWRASNAARRAARKRAIPAWAADEFDQFAVRECYDLAIRRTRMTGVPWHVDHQVPLQSTLVCGFHCAANLQVISGAENNRKRNHYWPDMP